MTANQILEFLNETPYVYFTTGIGGLVFSLDGNGANDETKIRVKTSKTMHGLEVSCNGSVFYFEWKRENRRWIFLTKREVSVR